MELNELEKALSAVERMLRARAALQSIMKAGYPKFIKGWTDVIEEQIRNRGESPIVILCDMAARSKDQLMTLAMLAATLEAIEKSAEFKRFTREPRSNETGTLSENRSGGNCISEEQTGDLKTRQTS